MAMPAFLLYSAEEKMNKVRISRCDLDASELALGCMRIADMTDQQIDTLIHTALDEGINFFDFADIYSEGQAEARFAEALKMTPSLREKLILQNKCDHHYNYNDASKDPNL